MNPIVLYFASGESLYSGALLLLIVILVSPFLRQNWTGLLRNVFGWLALLMIVMSSPPFPWIVDAAFLITFVIWYSVWNREPRKRNPRFFSAATLAFFLFVLPAIERLHRAFPILTGVPSDHLVVIGDSISAGLGSQSPWPTLFQQITNIPVRNISRVGATTTEAIQMATQVTPQDKLVLIEIGGNDLIANVASKSFEASLQAVISSLAAPGRTLVMFELPLLPHKVEYGQIQRRLAAKYGVWLIPKQYFVYIITGADATSDGLHLTPTGAERMARLVARVFVRVLKAR